MSCSSRLSQLGRIEMRTAQPDTVLATIWSLENDALDGLFSIGFRTSRLNDTIQDVLSC